MGPIKTECGSKVMPLETTPKPISQFPTNMADIHLEGGNNTCDTKDLPKIFNFKKALCFFLKRKTSTRMCGIST